MAAIPAADEDHSRGDTGIGENCSIMAGSARQSQCSNSLSCRKIMEALEKFPIHRGGTRSAPRSKIEIDTSCATNLVDERKETSVNSLEKGIAISSDIEAEPDFASYLAKGMMLQIGRDLTNRNRRVRSGFLKICPELIKPKRKLGNSKHGVAAETLWHRARMVIPTVADCIAVPKAAADTRHQTNRNRCLIEYRPLFDVNFEIGVDRLGLEPLLAPLYLLRMQTKFLHMSR